ncbi:hypothetical protein Phum_PHUM440240 [Pediculus humanus corporis]|uniref:Uncharacterized protein n=1 Tax=Pediculus humanus subsp. corporis TaxID=121224 RepID=E0VTY3_PEDHC|nr:uncharacterized protein Phum_PHUM440240 [Pediculus humanus corporis]EEB16839.1 hypothetical protein Phum_PHUM440240 [Pediculus humanus corporis]
MCGILWRNPGCVRLFAIIWAVVIIGYFGIGFWYFCRYMRFHANSILDGFFFYSNNYCFVGPDAILTIWHILTLALIILNLLMLFYVAYLLKYAHCVCFIPCSPNPCLKPPRPSTPNCCKKKPWIKRFLEPSQCCPPTKMIPQCPPPCPQKPCPVPCPRINVEFIPIPGSQKLACPDRSDPNRQLPMGQQPPQTQSQPQLQTQPYQTQGQCQQQQVTKCCSQQKTVSTPYNPNDGYCGTCSPQDVCSKPPSNLPPCSPPGPTSCSVPCSSVSQPSDRQYIQQTTTNKGKKKKIPVKKKIWEKNHLAVIL